MKREALRLWNINLEDNGIHILKDVSLTLWEGETLGIFGMNDSGISSLMRVLLQPHKPVTGNLYRLYASGEEESRPAQVIYIKVSNPMINNMTVWENTLVLKRHWHFAFFLSPRRMIRQLNSIFQEFDIHIDPHQYVSELKTIEKLQLDLIRAYIANARIVLMDDFSIDITPSEVRTLSRLIARMKEMGMSFVFAGHRIGNLLQLCDRICFMSNGTIIKTVDNTPRQAESIKEDINILTGHSSFHYATGHPGIGEPLLQIRAPGAGTLPPFVIPLYKGQVTAICDTTMKVNMKLARYFENEQISRHSGHSVVCSSFASDNSIIHALTVEDNLCFRKLKQYAAFGAIKKSLINFVGTEFLTWYHSGNLNLKEDCRNLSHTDSVAVHLFSILLSRPDVIIYNDSMSDLDYSTKYMILQELLKAAHAGHCSVCILNSNLDKLDDFADKYILITESEINCDASFQTVQLAYENR